MSEIEGDRVAGKRNPPLARVGGIGARLESHRWDFNRVGATY